MSEVSKFPQFTPLSLSHKEQLTKVYLQLHTPTSHRLFSNLFITDTDNTTEIAMLNQNVIVDRGLYVNHEGVMILGEHSIDDTVKQLFENNVAFVELSATQFQGATIDSDNSDYIYVSLELATLEGSNFAHLRRKVRQCDELYSFRVLENHQSDEVWELFNRWEENNAKKKDAIERAALEKALQFIDYLEIEYVGVYYNNSIVAFAGVEITSHQELMIHFIKAASEIAGLSEFLFHQLALMYKDRCPTINFQQDLGIDGLRRFKQSLRPTEVKKVYTILNKTHI